MADNNQLSAKDKEAYQFWVKQQMDAHRQQVTQKAQPQPFQPAENMDKQKIASGQLNQDPQSRAPQQNKSALRQAADMLSAGAHGMTTGMTFGKDLTQPDDAALEADAEHPNFKAGGQAIGSAISGAGIGRLLSPLIGAGVRTAGKAAGGVIESLPEGAKDAIGVASPRIKNLIDLLGKKLGGSAEAVGPIATAGQTASEVAEGAARSAPSPSSISLKDVFKTRSRGM